MEAKQTNRLTKPEGIDMIENDILNSQKKAQEEPKEVPMNEGITKERKKALDAAISQIERQFGKGSIMRLGDKGFQVKVDIIPTGSLSVDIALGIGGLPRGRVVEIYGPESSGKTTLALQAIANVHNLGGMAAFVDAEHAMDPDYAESLGVKIDSLLISQPDTGEQALEIAEALVRSGALDLVVVDSVAALVPKAELEGEMGDSHMGLQARLMSQALRKLTGIVSKSNTCMIFINQIRQKIGIAYGNPETTTGGNALKFYASVRLDIRKVSNITDPAGAVIGNRTRVKVSKNKLAPPYRVAEFDLIFGEGISKAGDLIDLGINFKFIDKTGSWLSYGETRLGQGRENARAFLKENLPIMDEIENKIRLSLGTEKESITAAK